ncbi:MAG: hypothetical protein CMG75_09320 [Candidatus Marinimicrobia bacterium]|nr:hypothetical protein [Candidatus Neomarinimicrobiota bacterium]|tara:strand:+ start:35294 stop:35929 length:636 start_codon:yes stop_codon:yes gene_type:complete
MRYLCYNLLLWSSFTFSQVDYSSLIQPIFDQYCTSCHGSSGGISLTSYEELMKGGNSGASIIAGDATNSLLIKRINGSVNPLMPKDAQALPDSIINLIMKWINEGAAQTVSITAVNTIPFTFEILGNYPNPFNPRTIIKIQSKVNIDGRAKIISTSGRSVYDFGRVYFTIGKNNIFWDAEDDQGIKLPSGPYIFLFRSSGIVFSHRMTLLK